MLVRGNAINDNAVAHVYHAIKINRGLGIVRDHYDRLPQVLVQPPQHFQYDFRILGIEIARGLIRQQNFRLIDDGPGNRHALLFAPRLP